MVLLGVGTPGSDPDAGERMVRRRTLAAAEAVVALFASADLTSSTGGAAANLMGYVWRDPVAPPLGIVRDDDLEVRQYRQASPIAHVTADDPRMLLLHGDRDTVVPIEQSIRMKRH